MFTFLCIVCFVGGIVLGVFIQYQIPGTFGGLKKLGGIFKKKE